MPEVQCPNCRAVASSEAAFCASCGASLASVKAGSLPMPSMGGTPSTSPLPSPVMTGGPAAPPPPAAAAPPPAPAPGATPTPTMPATSSAPLPPPATTITLPPAIANMFGTPSPMSPQLDTARRLGREAFVHRLIAFFIDAIMIGVIANVLFFSFWWGIGALGGLIWWWVPSILMAVYMFVLEGSGGQTLGKMLLGIRVVREDLGPVTHQNIQPRCIGILLYPLVIPAILDLLLVSGEGQSLGDRWAHTTVIKVQ